MLRFTVISVLCGFVWLMTLTPPASAQSTDPAGGGNAHSTVQPSLGLRPIVRVGGPNFSEIGEVKWVASSNVPANWAPANGQTLPIATNTALFARLGTTYGGNGQTTFKLPDLRGRSIMGTGNGPGLTPRSLGAAVGSLQETFTVDQMPAHAHGLAGASATGMAGGSSPVSLMQPTLALHQVFTLFGTMPSATTVTAPPWVAQIKTFASTQTPDFGIHANGQLLLLAENETAFQLIGNAFGGNGQSTFAVPNLGGRVAIQEGAGPGLTPRAHASSYGQESTVLTSAQMAAHDHPQPGTDAAGGGDPYSLMQPSLTLQYLISTDGVFPTSGEDPGNDPFLGEIALFAGNLAPRGWSFCDGQLLSIDHNQTLFSLLGNDFGGDGQNTFALPDLRGRTPSGVDGASIVRGTKLGAESHAMTIDELPTHVHAVPEPTSGMGLVTCGILAMSMRRHRAA